MSKTSAIFISDVQEEFEGGNSLSVDWDTVIRRSIENTIDNCRPETLKRRVPIYGGIAQDLYVYYCPADVLVPSGLYSNDGLRKYSYSAPKLFHEQNYNNTFTIEYINGVRFLMLRQNESVSSITLDIMQTVGTKTGGGVVLNQHNFLLGSSSIQATFTDAGITLSDTLSESIDITDYLRGSIILPSYLTTADDLTSIEVRLLSSAGNYYSVTTTADSIGDYFADGWNMIRFDMASASTTGSPDKETITDWEIIGTTDSGKTLTIIFDKFTIQKTNVFYLEYYSNRVYINGTTGALWKADVSSSSSDLINLDRDTIGIAHYEACLLVTQMATFDAIDSQASKRFEGQLQRKYQAYYDIHPSSEKPVTYSVSPEVRQNDDLDFGTIQDNTVSII